MTSTALDALCAATKQHIISFLPPDHYATVKSLRKRRGEDEKDMSSCLSKFTLVNVESYYRFRKFVIPYYIQRLSINCVNMILPTETVILPQLKHLTFFVEYRLTDGLFHWRRFFEMYKMPQLESVHWNNVRIDFLEMKRIFMNLHICDQIKNIKIVPSRPFLSSLFTQEGASPHTKDLVEFYKIFPRLENMRLDYEEKHLDVYYFDMFRNSSDFSCLRSIQLVNRSFTLMNHICKKRDILPMLQKLEILWLFDDSIFTENGMVDMDDELSVEIHKPFLQILRLCIMSWSKINEGTVCSLKLFSKNNVSIFTENVQIHVLDCPNGYSHPH